MPKHMSTRRLVVTSAAIIAAAATAAPVSPTSADERRSARATQPKVSVSPSKVAPGGAIVVTGRNWPAGRAVRLHFGRPLGEDIVLEPIGLVKANSRGRFRRTLWVAEDAPGGSYSIAGCRRECEVMASADFHVSGPAPPPSSPPTSAPPSRQGAAASTHRPFLVPLTGGFGAFVDRLDPEASPAPARLRAALGPPSRVERGPAGVTCRMHWRSVGVTAFMFTVGDERRSACKVGVFSYARLTDSRWHTASGVRPGSPERTARRAALRRCPRGQRCHLRRYTLSVHPSDCAGGLVPTVVAEVRRGRVRALVVNSLGCE